MHMLILVATMLSNAPVRQPQVVTNTRGVWTHCEAPRALATDYRATVKVCK